MPPTLAFIWLFIKKLHGETLEGATINTMH